MGTYNPFKILWVPNFSEEKAELLEKIGGKLVVQDKIFADLGDSIEKVDNGCGIISEAKIVKPNDAWTELLPIHIILYFVHLLEFLQFFVGENWI